MARDADRQTADRTRADSGSGDRSGSDRQIQGEIPTRYHVDWPCSDSIFSRRRRSAIRLLT